MTEKQRIELQVEPGPPVRLDVYLCHHLPGFSRSRIQKLIEAGLVTVSARAAKASRQLGGGELLVISVPADEPPEVAAQDIPLEIIFQDDYLAVLNKPTGMVTHPGAGVSSGTLVNALLHHLGGRLSGISGVLRPGIVHRLDKDTSGLLVVAKEDRAHRHLAEQIRAKTARRVYLALVEGSLPRDKGTIDKPVGRHPTRRKEMAIVPTGRHAVTHYEVVRRWPAYTLVKAALETGRTHQIRVHMADLGCPVVGDIVYNRKRTGSPGARARLGLKGHALHAAYLSFTHPVTGSLLEFEARLPEDLQKLLESL